MDKQNLQLLFEYVDQHFDEMVQELKDICSFRSVSGDKEGLKQTKNYILRKMEQLDLEHREYDDPKADSAIIASDNSGDSSKSIIFYNHYDVMPEGDPESWTNKQPFQADIRDGRIYARGVSDNKGGLLCRLHAIEAIRAVNKTLPVHLKFFYDGEEESSSYLMEKMAMEEKELFIKLIDADIAIWEGGLIDDEGNPYGRFGVRGDCSFHLSVKTAEYDCHGRYGATVPGAAWRLIWALASLKGPDEKIRIPGFYSDVIPTTQDDLEVLHAFPFDEEGFKKKTGFDHYVLNATGDELKRRLYMEPTLSVCGLDSGDLCKNARSIVPHSASALISSYLVADQDPEEIRQNLRSYLDSQGFSDIEITYGGGSKAIRTKVTTPFRQVMEQASMDVFHKPLVTEISQMGAGPAFLWREVLPDQSIVSVGPANPESHHHAQDENLRLEDYKNSIKYIIALLYAYAEQSN